MKIEGLGEKVAGEIQKGPLEKSVERELSLLEKVGGKIIVLNDDAYPKRLKDIYDPPALLYVRGELRREDELAVAIVGSRKTSPYGDGSQKRLTGPCLSWSDHCQRNGEGHRFRGSQGPPSRRRENDRRPGLWNRCDLSF